MLRKKLWKMDRYEKLFKVGLYLIMIMLTASVVWVRAATPSGTISYQGYLTDASGRTVTGNFDMNIAFYNDATAGTNQYAEDHDNIRVGRGRFELELGAGAPTLGTWGALDFSQALWMEITADGETFAPRIPLSAVPYARFAFQSQQIGTLNAGGWCTSNGSVINCEQAAPDANTDAVGDLSCANGQVAKWNGAAWACAADTDTTIADTTVPNTGAELVGATLRITDSTSTITANLGALQDGDTIADLPCTNGQVAKWNGAAWACAADTDTTVPNTGAELVGVTLRITDSNSTITANLGALQDGDTTYTAGTGLSLGGTVFSLTTMYRLPQACNTGDAAYWGGGAWLCSDYAYTLPTADGTANQVLQTDGSGSVTWQTASGGASQLTDLSDVGSAGATSGNMMIADGTDWDSVGMSGDVNITSAGLTTIQDGAVDLNDLADTCTANEVIKRNAGGTAWECAADATGGGGLATPLQPTGTAATVSSCQYGSIVGNGTAGIVTFSTEQSTYGCTINLQTTFTNGPVCALTVEDTVNDAFIVQIIGKTATSITIKYTGASDFDPFYAGMKIHYICMGY